MSIAGRLWRRFQGLLLDVPAEPAERMLYKFGTQVDLTQWEVFSDSEHGGRSTAELSLQQPTETAGPSSEAASRPGTAIFRGELSTDITDDSTRLRRSGFCGMRTRKLPEDATLGLDDLEQLVLRVRGDGRVYIASLRTEHEFAGAQRADVWAAFLFARAGHWTEVTLPFSRFLLTVNGRVAVMSPELHPPRIVGMGLALASDGAGGGPPVLSRVSAGPFHLELDWIKASRREGPAYRGARE